MSLIKIINLPLEETDFKIVQLYHGSERIMLCGNPKKRKEHFHFIMLEKYLKENNINYDYFAPNTDMPMSVIPRPEKGGIYKVTGMGYACIDQQLKYFQLPYGSSKDYNLRPDPEFQEILREMFKKDSPYWEELELERKNNPPPQFEVKF